MKHVPLTILAALGVITGLLNAQQYRCDWNVAAQAGGELSSTAYRCGATAGQTAAGHLAGPVYRAVVGFWQSDFGVGIRERTPLPNEARSAARLYPPAPNPFRTHLAIHYALAADGPASLYVHDVAGRVVRGLVASSVKRGAYSVVWDGRDNRGRVLPGGIYFCRMSTGDYLATEKLVLQR